MRNSIELYVRRHLLLQFEGLVLGHSLYYGYNSRALDWVWLDKEPAKRVESIGKEKSSAYSKISDIENGINAG